MSSEPKPGTPLPWRLEYPLGESEPAIFAGDSNEYIWIATVGHDEDYGEQSAISITKRDCVANARYIIHACNTLAELQKPCVWTYDDAQGYWHTSCLEMFPMPEFVPSDNKMKFCCFCSHPIQEVTEE